MYDPSLRTKSYITVAVICVGFAIMVPIVFKPFFLRMLGHSPTPAAHLDNDRRNTERVGVKQPSKVIKPPLHHRGAELKAEKSSQRKGGILSVILPIYALGIFVYFAYIMFKLFGNKNQTVPSKKEKYLKDYYRNFRYNVEKEKFMMDSDSSDDDNLLLRESFCGKTRRSHTRSVNPRNAFDWSRAYGENEGELGMSPDIYRSAKSLPRDLEYLLKKVDDNNLDDAEIHRLRVRLEEVEQEMTRLLEVVNSAALPGDSIAAKPPCTHHRYQHPHQREEEARDSSECIEKTDDDEELLSASEGEDENHEVSLGASAFSPRGSCLTPHCSCANLRGSVESRRATRSHDSSLVRMSLSASD